MALNKKSSKISKFSNFSKNQIILALVFVVGFGGVGLYKLAFSSAATPSVLEVQYSNAQTALANDPLVNVVNDPISHIGSQQVVRLSAGQVANFKPTFDAKPNGAPRACFYLRDGRAFFGDINPPAKVIITAGVNQMTVYPLLAGADDNYEYFKYCLNYKVAANFDFKIESLEGIVNVYQVVFEYRVER